MHTGRWVVGLIMVALVLGACRAGGTGSGSGAGGEGRGASAGRAAGAPGAGADYFAGKTVTLQVNYSPGGPTDVTARLIAQYLDKHVPGKPQIIVENKAGAGGLIGKNYIYNA